MHCKPSPCNENMVSLCAHSHRENPSSITWVSLCPPCSALYGIVVVIRSPPRCNSKNRVFRPYLKTSLFYACIELFCHDSLMSHERCAVPAAQDVFVCNGELYVGLLCPVLQINSYSLATSLGNGFGFWDSIFTILQSLNLAIVTILSPDHQQGQEHQKLLANRFLILAWSMQCVSCTFAI